MIHYVKYCKTEHNIVKGCRYLQIGTAQYYKDVENTAIKDRQEGIVIEEFTPDKKIVIGKPIKGYLDDGIYFDVGSMIHIEYDLPLVYMFCCSQTTEPSIEKAKLFDYDDYYEIHDINGFSEQITGILKNRFDEEIYCIHDVVKYVDEKKQKLDSEDKFWDAVYQFRRDLYFEKLKVSVDHPSVNYKANKEYRFIWIPYQLKRHADTNGTGTLITIKNEPIHLEANLLKCYVR
jgi:hypothetical protein